MYLLYCISQHSRIKFKKDILKLKIYGTDASKKHPKKNTETWYSEMIQIMPFGRENELLDPQKCHR